MSADSIQQITHRRHFKEKWEKYNTANFVLFLWRSHFKLVLRVSSGFQTLENNKTTRPAASWFQMFSHVWKHDETLALVFEIVLESGSASSFLSGLGRRL